MRNCINKQDINRQIQRGVIVIVCLIFLLVFSTIALTGMDITILEERMAGNMLDQNRAFQAAEASLATAETWLQLQTSLPPASDNDNGGSTVVWQRNAAAAPGDTEPWWLARESDWWQEQGLAVTGVLSVHTQPQYIIEEYFSADHGNSLTIGDADAAPVKALYRITARGLGAGSNSQVLLQVIYARTYD